MRRVAALSGFGPPGASNDTTAAVTTGVDTDIAGQRGTLHLKADGSYTYQWFANNVSSNATDVFVYTIKYGDGDLSTTTLTINLADVTLVAPPDNDVTVNEAALDLVKDPGDLAAGTVIGSLPGLTAQEPTRRTSSTRPAGLGRCTTSWSAAATR